MLKFLKKALNSYHGQRDKQWKRLMKRHALSCNRCNRLAIPVYGTGNKYECLGCGRRFTNSTHNIAKELGNVQSHHHENNYNDLAKELKSEV